MSSQDLENEIAASALGLRSNAYDYASHVRMVHALSQQDMAKAHEARRLFCSLLPMTQEDWIKWLQEVSASAQASSSHSIQAIFDDLQAVGEAAILDCPSPAVWAEFATCVDQFSNYLDDIDERESTAHHPPCSLTSEAVARQVRSIFEDGSKSPAAQSSESFVFWSKFARWEMDEAMDIFELKEEASQQGADLDPTAAAALTRELTQAIARVNAVFAAWLAVPSPHLSEALAALTAWLGSAAGSSLPPGADWQEQLQHAATAAAERWASSSMHRERVESARQVLASPQGDASAAQGELVAAWCAWVQEAEGKGQQQAVVVLDEAVRSAYWDASLWDRYISLCSKLYGGPGAAAQQAGALCRVARRATRNCMWHAGFWSKYLQSVEWSVACGAQAPLHPFSAAHAAARQANASGSPPPVVAALAVAGEASEAAGILSRGDLQAPLFLLAAMVWSRVFSQLSHTTPAGPSLLRQGAAGSAESNQENAMRAANKCFKQAAHQARSAAGEQAAAPIQRLWAEVQCSKFNQWPEGAETWKALIKASPKDASLCAAAASCAARCGQLEQAHEWMKSGLHFQAADPASTMWLQQEWQALNAVYGGAATAWAAQSVIDQRVQAAQQRVAAKAAAAERRAAKRARPEQPSTEPGKAGSDSQKGKAQAATSADTELGKQHTQAQGQEAGSESGAPMAATAGDAFLTKTGGAKRRREESAQDDRAPSAAGGAAPPPSMSTILARLAEAGGASAVGDATASEVSAQTGATGAGAAEPKRARREESGGGRRDERAQQDEGPSEEALARSGGVDSRSLVMVFVNNLAYQATEALVQEAFAKAGKVHQVRLRRDDAGKIRGFGTVSLDPTVPPPAAGCDEAADGKTSASTVAAAGACGDAPEPNADEVKPPSGGTAAASDAPMEGEGDTRSAVLKAALALDGNLLLGRPLQVSEFKPMSKRWKDVKASGRAPKQDLVLPSAKALGVAPKRKRTTSATAMVPPALRKKAAAKAKQQ